MNTIKRLLIGTPTRGNVPLDYLAWLLKQLSIGLPGWEVRIRFMSGGTVATARNEIAYTLLVENYDEVLMVDADMKPTCEQVTRIMSHDVDFVGGPYCKRKGGQPDWTFTPKPNGDRRDSGLIECTAIGTGFQRVRRKVFEAIKEMFPEREYFDPVKRGSSTGRKMFEFFPMGVIGPRMPEQRLRRVKAILSSPTDGSLESIKEALNSIQSAAFDEQPLGSFLGEDYYFCTMATRAGFKIYADTGMAPVGHVGNIVFPITEDQVGMRPNQINEVTEEGFTP